MSKILSTIFLVAAFWALAIIVNQMNPTLGTGLGVPLSFVGGLALGVIFTLAVFLISRRRPAIRPYYFVVIIAGLANAALYPLANQGAFSVVQ